MVGHRCPGEAGDLNWAGEARGLAAAVTSPGQRIYVPLQSLEEFLPCRRRIPFKFMPPGHRNLSIKSQKLLTGLYHETRIDMTVDQTIRYHIHTQWAEL